MRTGTSTRTLQKWNNRLNNRIQSLHVGMQPTGSSVTRTKEMLAYVGQHVWLVSNWTQHMPTSCNIGQHGVQTNATCCAQHVGATCCIRLHGPLGFQEGFLNLQPNSGIFFFFPDSIVNFFAYLFPTCSIWWWHQFSLCKVCPWEVLEMPLRIIFEVFMNPVSVVW